MSALASRISMTPDQFKKMAKIIYDRSGIHFPDNKKYVIESRLSHRLGELELEDFDQYIAYLTQLVRNSYNFLDAGDGNSEFFVIQLKHHDLVIVFLFFFDVIVVFLFDHAFLRNIVQCIL